MRGGTEQQPVGNDDDDDAGEKWHDDSARDKSGKDSGAGRVGVSGRDYGGG